MISTCQKILTGCRNEKIKLFLNKILDAFGKELEKVATAMYKYPHELKGIDGKEDINDVFALIERSYVGLLNNVIIKKYPKAVTLQEFTVYKKDSNAGKDKLEGRADLLVDVVINNTPIRLLFEAKAYTAARKQPKKGEMQAYYQRVRSQAMSYYEAEKEYYNTLPYIVTINFDWIRDTKLLVDLKKNEFVDDGCTDFYYIYHTDMAGLMVYGSVTKLG